MNLTFNPKQEELFHQATHSVGKTVNLKSLGRAEGTTILLLALAVTSEVPTAVFLTDTPRHVFSLMKAHCPAALLSPKSNRIEYNGVTILLRDFNDDTDDYRGLGNSWVINDGARDWSFNAKAIKRFFRDNPRVMKIINVY